MKKLWIILAALILAACSGQPKTDATEPQGAEAAIGAEWVEVVLNVEGMTCDGCENAIKAGVESLEGIAGAIEETGAGIERAGEGQIK